MNAKWIDYPPSLGISEVASAVLSPILVPSVKKPRELTRRGETSGGSPRGLGDWNMLQTAGLPCCTKLLWEQFPCFAEEKAE